MQDVPDWAQAHVPAEPSQIPEQHCWPDAQAVPLPVCMQAEQTFWLLPAGAEQTNGEAQLLLVVQLAPRRAGAAQELPELQYEPAQQGAPLPHA